LAKFINIHSKSIRDQGSLGCFVCLQYFDRTSLCASCDPSVTQSLVVGAPYHLRYSPQMDDRFPMMIDWFNLGDQSLIRDFDDLPDRAVTLNSDVLCLLRLHKSIERHVWDGFQ
jgi:hypothetical protein